MEQQEEEGEPIYVSEFATEEEEEEEEEEEVAFDSRFVNGCSADDDGWSKKLAKVVNSGIEEAREILDENRVLINELDHNRDSETGDDLALNIALLGELNENMHRAAELHAGLAAAIAGAGAERKKKNAAGKRSRE